MTATPSDPRPATSTPAQSSGPATGSVPVLPAKATPALPAGPSSAQTTDGRPVVNAALKKSTRPAQARAGGGTGPVITATLALIVAAGAILVAVYALNVARDAKSNAAAAKSFANQAGSPPKAAAPRPTQVPTTPSPTPSPTAVFLPDLRDVQLVIPPTDGCQSMFVDVDTGQWGNYTGHDFYFSACLGPLTAHLDNVDAGAAVTGTVTADACASQLAGTGATAGDLELPVAAGTTICLITSKTQAQQAGIPQHLAVVQIRQIAADRTVTLNLDTYKLPA